MRLGLPITALSLGSRDAGGVQRAEATAVVSPEYGSTANLPTGAAGVSTNSQDTIRLRPQAFGPRCHARLAIASANVAVTVAAPHRSDEGQRQPSK